MTSPTVAPRQGGSPPLEPAPEGHGHVDALDVVRPVASVWVILTHAVQAFAVGSSVAAGAVLAETHASREVFFFVSGLVLIYQAEGRPGWTARGFWRRHAGRMAVPYLVWTGVYVALSFAGLVGVALSSMTGSPARVLRHVGVLVATGSGHLYFLVVLGEFYLVFPAFRWLLRRTRGHHGAVVAVSLAAQAGLMAAIHVGWTPPAMQGPWAGRELTTYQGYLVVGGVVGAHLPEVHRWVWRHRWPLVAVVAVVAVGTEVAYLATVAAGASPQVAADPFAPWFILFNLAAVAGLYLAGAWWARRRRAGRLADLVRATSDNSFGVYLSHAVFLDLGLSLGLRTLEPGLPWPVVVVLSVVTTWLAASGLTVVLARTPLSFGVVGRARRPVHGGPAPVGRGTKGVAPARRRAVAGDPG